MIHLNRLLQIYIREVKKGYIFYTRGSYLNVTNVTPF